MEKEREEMESMNGPNKRVCVSVENGAVCTTGGRWDELNPEILASIFIRIVPPDLMVRSVVLVCRNWMETVSGPSCWMEIDLENWCRKCCIAKRPHLIDLGVSKAVRRSRSTVQQLTTYRLGIAGFSAAARRYCFVTVFSTQFVPNSYYLVLTLKIMGLNHLVLL